MYVHICTLCIGTGNRCTNCVHDLATGLRTGPYAKRSEASEGR